MSWGKYLSDFTKMFNYTNFLKFKSDYYQHVVN